MISTLRQLAGVAEVVKGAGLKIRSHMGSWVRIPPPAPRYCAAFLLHFTPHLTLKKPFQKLPDSGKLPVCEPSTY